MNQRQMDYLDGQLDVAMRKLLEESAAADNVDDNAMTQLRVERDKEIRQRATEFFKPGTAIELTERDTKQMVTAICGNGYSNPTTLEALYKMRSKFSESIADLQKSCADKTDAILIAKQNRRQRQRDLIFAKGQDVRDQIFLSDSADMLKALQEFRNLKLTDIDK